MWKTITAILALTAINCVMLLTGHNGQATVLICSGIAGLGGYAIMKDKIKEHNEN